jgi:parvulin-like peptidyl-prolyl isomerase
MNRGAAPSTPSAEASSAPSGRPAAHRRQLAAIAAGAVITTLALAGCASSDTPGNDEAAMVNGQAIAVDRLDREAKTFERRAASGGQPVDAASASRQALQSLIQQRILLDGAKGEGIEISDADIDAQIKKYEEQAASGGQKLDDILTQQGISREDLREQARVEAAVERVGNKLVPGKSDAEIAAEANARRGEFLQVQARHVLVKDEAAAKRVRTELERSDDWATAAKQSQDPGSKDKGGDLGFISKGQTVPEFDKSLYELAEQGNCKGAQGACKSPISQPVKSQFGWHVLQVTGVRLPQGDELRAAVEGQDFAQRRQTALQDWFKELLTGAKVVVNPRFGQWDAAKGEIVDRGTAPQPAPTPGATPNPAQQAPQTTVPATNAPAPPTTASP